MNHHEDVDVSRPIMNVEHDAICAQLRASDPKVSAWVNANAGSGKTHILVQRVLRLMLSGADPGRILCLTFTRAAAAEMSNRIFAHLGKWASADDATLSGLLIEEMGESSPAPERLSFARTLLAHVLETPGGLRIQTVHAFCERILRQFSFEASVASDFRIIDDMMKADLLEHAQMLLFVADNRDGKYDILLDELIPRVDRRRFATLMIELIGKRDVLRQWLRVHGGLGPALENLRSKFGLMTDDCPEKLERAWLDAPCLPCERWPEFVDLLRDGSSSDRKKADALERACLAANDHDRREAYRSFILNQKGRVHEKLITMALQKKIGPERNELLDREKIRVSHLVRTERALDIWNMTAALLRLGDALMDRCEALKQRAGQLDYDDLIDRVLNLLGHTDNPNWVMYKLDGGMDHILIDEAQDMSSAPWRVVEYLTEDLHAATNGSNRTIFVVGDEKQSIYSFQGVRAEIFARMRDRFAERARSAGAPWVEENMTLSFRSVPAILEVVDAVFANTPCGVDQPVFHDSARRNDQGLVELWPVEDWSDDDDAASWRHPRLRFVNDVAERIAAMIAGDVLTDGEEGRQRRVRPGDILILLRKRGELLTPLIDALHRHAIPVSGADSLSLKDHIAVQDLIVAGEVALLPDDDLKLATFLKGPLVGLDEDALFTLAHGRSACLWEALAARRDEEPFADAHARLSLLRERVGHMRPYEFFVCLLGTDGGRQRLIARLGSEAMDVIDEFLSCALTYEETNIPDLQGFLYWFCTQNVQIKRDMEENSGLVRVMTVHGAKGLEAPVVVLIDSLQVPSSSDLLVTLDQPDGEGNEGIVWIPGGRDNVPPFLEKTLERAAAMQLAEYNRLLYVAMTRARDRLYVCGLPGTRKKATLPEDCWYQRIRTALQSLGSVASDDGRGIMRYGQPLPPTHVLLEEEMRAVDMEEEDIVCPAWMSQPVKVAAHERVSDSRRRERGEAMHHLLEILPAMRDGSARDRFSVASESMVKRLPEWSDDQRDALIREACAIVDDPRFAGFFVPGSFAEVEIATLPLDDGTDVNKTSSSTLRRIDRLVVDGDDILIADYKTDLRVPACRQSVPPAYLKQLESYRMALVSLFPNRRIRCFLIWTANASIMEIE